MLQVPFEAAPGWRTSSLYLLRASEQQLRRPLLFGIKKIRAKALVGKPTPHRSSAGVGAATPAPVTLCYDQGYDQDSSKNQISGKMQAK
jgi:hypothetical protein